MLTVAKIFKANLLIAQGIIALIAFALLNTAIVSAAPYGDSTYNNSVYSTTTTTTTAPETTGALQRTGITAVLFVVVGSSVITTVAWSTMKVAKRDKKYSFRS